MNRNAHLFMVPGPVAPPDYVMEAICRPVMHQRTGQFRDFCFSLQDDLRYVFQTAHPVLMLNGSGTFAVELAMHNVFRPGDRVAIPAMGKFSERWASYALEMGLEAVPLGITWGHELTVAQVEEVMAEYPDLKGWVLTHCETSTGVGIDLEEMAASIRATQPNSIIVVDAVSTLAVQPLYTDAWDLDVVVTASQKGFLNPAGTAYLSLSPRAQARLLPAESESWFDFSQYLQALQRGDYPFTPPTQMLYGVKAALGRIREEGLPAVWNRVHQLSRHCKQRLPEIGADLYGAANADALTAFSLGRVDHDLVRERLLVEHGVELAGGQGRISDLIIRIGHFGAHGMPELERCLQAIQAVIPAFAK
jgi:aspartate aminotransferase-like enzyme